MYCKKCGKYIGDDRDLCDDCITKINNQLILEKQSTPYNQINQNNSVRQGRVMDGFGKALTAVILSIVGGIFFFFSFIGLGITSLSGSIVVGFYYFMIVGISIAGNIIAIVFGIQSIILFVNAKKENRVKPIPALVMGIEALITSAVIAVYMLIFGFFAFVAVMAV